MMAPMLAGATRTEFVNQITREIEARKDLVRSLEQEKKLRQVGASNKLARRTLVDLGQAYNVRQKAGMGAEANFNVLSAQTVTGLSDRRMRSEGRRILANSVLREAAAEVRRNPELRDEYARMVAKVEKTFRRLGTNVKVVNGAIVEGTQRQWKLIADSMASNAERAREATSRAFTAIQQQAVGALQAMGFDAGTSRSIVASIERGGTAAAAATGQAAAGPGAYVSTAGGAPSYAAAAPGAKGKRDGPGRQLQSAGGSRGGGGVPSQLVSVGRWLQAQGFQVGENPAFGGVHPVHVPGSYHYRGQAIDVNWPNAAQEPGMLDRIYPMLAAMHPTELLWRVAGHYDHLHLAMGGGPGGSYVPGMGGGGLFSAINLMGAARVGMGGLGGAVGGGAARLYAAGLGSKLNSAAQTGFAGWFGAGGQFTARRPTLFGVGESGEETVTVTPHTRHGGRRGVVIEHMTIQNHRPGDIRRQVREEVMAAFDDLDRELAGLPMQGDEEALV
jgi:hypothetical protein